MNEQIPWTFKTWIALFKGVDLPIGDLADAISKDEDFPDEDYFDEMWEHISQKSKYDPDYYVTRAVGFTYQYNW